MRDLDTTRSGASNRRTSVSWGAPFVLGMLVSVTGVLAIISSFIAGIASVLVFGVLLFVSGLFEIGHAFRVWKSGPGLLYLLAGVLTAVVGALFAFRPLVGLASVTLLVAAYFFASGLFRSIVAAVDRYPRWGYDVFGGVVALILGVIVIAQWPLSSVWLVGTLLGVEMLFRGTSLMGGSLVLRRVIHEPGRATA